MQQQAEKGFLDELADLRPEEQLRFLAGAAGNLIADLAEDPRQARDAVDKLFILIEKSAGLRL